MDGQVMSYHAAAFFILLSAFGAVMSCIALGQALYVRSLCRQITSDAAKLTYEIERLARNLNDVQNAVYGIGGDAELLRKHLGVKICHVKAETRPVKASE